MQHCTTGEEREPQQGHPEALPGDLTAQAESSIIATDLSGTITLFNRGAEILLGYQACEAHGLPISRLIAAPGRESVLVGHQAFEAIASQVRLRGDWTGDRGLTRRDGSPLPVQLRVSLMLDGSGQNSGYLCILRIASGSRSQEDELALNREMLKATLEAVPHPAYIKDRDGIYTECNARFANFLGLDKTEIIGFSAARLSSSRAWQLDTVPETESTKNASAQGPAPANRPDLRKSPAAGGPSAVLLFREEPLWASDGSEFGIAGSILDVTDQTRIEEQLQRRSRMLEEEIAKHQQAEEALVQRERMLSLVINAVPQSIFWKDTNLEYVGCNHQFARAIGLPSPADVVGKTDYDLPWRTEEAEDFRRDDLEVMRLNQTKHSIKESLQQADGSSGILDARKIPLRSDCGKVVGVLGVFEDITKRIGVERNLRESEERLRVIFEASLAGIVMLAPDGTISFANRRMAEMLGVGIDELLGSRYSSWLHWSNQREGEALAKRLVAGEVKSVTTERHYLRRDGSDFWGYLSGRRLENSDGSLCALVGCIADITEQKASQDALEREKERLAVTLRSIGDGVITVDTEGRVVLLNRVAEELCGYSQLEAAGLPLDRVFNVVDERTRLPKENCIAQVLGSGEVVEQSGHGLLVSRDGQERIVVSKTAPILDRGREIPGAVLVFSDITDRRRIEEELFKARKLESLGILAGGIAHDFNNLMTGIMGNISLSRAKLPDNHEAALFLDRARKGAEQSKDLTLQLLTFSKGGAPVKKLTSMSQILMDTAVFALRGSNVRCVFDIDPGLWSAEVDPGQMSQVIGNLVINADQAMPDGGSIVVRAENVLQLDDTEPGNRIRITFKDTGTGISGHDLSRIYDPYFSTKTTGNGLGLATVYAIVKNHDGEIRVFSRLGHGTTFAITLPALPGRPAQQEQREPQPETCAIAGSGRILLMDDEDSIREMAVAALSMFGYLPVVACNGEEALELYQKALDSGERFDVVVMDLTVPGAMGGKEAVRKLLELDPHALALASSGYSEDPVMANYRDYGFSGIVSKPYTLQHLDSVIQEILATRKP